MILSTTNVLTAQLPNLYLMAKNAQLVLHQNFSIKLPKLVKLVPRLKSIIQLLKPVYAQITISGTIRNVFLASSQNTLISQPRLASLVLQD